MGNCIHLAVLNNASELQAMCGSKKDECWVRDKKDATCKKCLEDVFEYEVTNGQSQK